jgi:hypothetical protein
MRLEVPGWQSHSCDSLLSTQASPIALTVEEHINI